MIAVYEGTVGALNQFHSRKIVMLDFYLSSMPRRFAYLARRVRLPLLALAFASPIAIAQTALDPGGKTTVVRVSSYNAFGGGDVIFTVANPTSACYNGYWIAKSDPGFSANLGLILSAYHSKASVEVFGFTDQIWQGSPGGYCKLYVINLA